MLVLVVLAVCVLVCVMMLLSHPLTPSIESEKQSMTGRRIGGAHRQTDTHAKGALPPEGRGKKKKEEEEEEEEEEVVEEDDKRK